ncbi:hypothetical protein K493DRAFT_353902 [Basidiobolus meristosporus CBS 931.73]|uniref:Uncharacterized protein n=1 Tax=Basidiobolus meristosporus CBS 931.73 TaxID=1314790 RepID=A0A1Y1Y5M3_9FUNG|nr:hypothetical protein K493DRAFT_353902 [Basidiobolus meristosporus CBS 931.73]|eukprot:ORX92904.1 hypothetical protein K493DRAFT_353902 [Basidiobolus meristosporus CBS 931.73]
MLRLTTRLVSKPLYPHFLLAKAFTPRFNEDGRSVTIKAPGAPLHASLPTLDHTQSPKLRESRSSLLGGVGRMKTHWPGVRSLVHLLSLETRSPVGTDWCYQGYGHGHGYGYISSNHPLSLPSESPGRSWIPVTPPTLLVITTPALPDRTWLACRRARGRIKLGSGVA